MSRVEVYRTADKHTNIFPLEASRDWMPENKYAYHCVPVTISNKLGYGVSFDEDISFIWDGSFEAGDDGHIKVLEGSEYCFFGRGGGVIGFPTNLIFKTDKDTSILTMPVPNQFIDGVQCFTSVLSSSFYTGALHIVWKVTTPNKVIKIKAGTPLAAILPISVKSFHNTTLTMMDDPIEMKHGKDYIDSMFEYGRINHRVTDWYRNALDHLGNKIGEHEVQSLKFKIEREKS